MDEVSPFEPTVVGSASRHWRLVVLVVLALVIPASFYAFTRPDSYSITASLTVSDPRGPGVLGGAPEAAPDRYVSDQLVVFRSAPLGHDAALRAGRQKPPLRKSSNWFLSHTSARAAAANNNVLSVKFTAPTASQALAGVKAVVAGYEDVVRASMARQAERVVARQDASIRSTDERLRRLQPFGTDPTIPLDPTIASQIQQLTLSRSDLVARRDLVAGEAAFPGSGVAQALLPNQATTAGKSAALRIIVLAIVLGLLLGIALAYLRSYRKRVFVHPRDPELLLDAPLLIDVSSLRTVDLLGVSQGDNARVEATAQELFAIAASLLVDRRAGIREGGLSVAVVSAQNGASCTAIAWRSSLALASQGLRVLLIDVEASWPPAAAWMARVTDHLVWEERADGAIALAEPPPPVRRPGPFVGRLPAGESSGFGGHPQSALYLCSEAPPVRSQKALRAVFRELERDFDFIMVNAPPFLPSASAAHLTSAAGTALIVVPSGASITDHEDLMRRLRLTAAIPLGYVYCCADCDVPIPAPGGAFRLRRALHAEPKPPGPALQQVSGVEGTRLTSGRP